MSTINDLSTVSTVDSADKIPLWSTANGVTRGLPISVLDERYLSADDVSSLAASAVVETFVAGTDFTPGVTVGLTLANQYYSAANIEAFFDAAFQGPDQYSLTGFGIAFTSPIPVGIERVYVRGGASRLIGVPSDGTVGDAQINQGSTFFTHIYSFVGSKDFGATGNGTTDDSAKLLAAAASASATGKELVITPGNYLIGASITLTPFVRFMAGAKLTITGSAIVTFMGGMDAPPVQIFVTPGATNVVVNGAISRAGYPEWWGAIAEIAINGTFTTGLADCSSAINACIVAFPVTQFQAGIYHTLNTVFQSTLERSVLGAGGGMAVSAGAVGTTTILMDVPGGTIWQIGPSTGTTPQPSNSLKNIMLQRSVAPNISDNTNCGLFLRYVAWTELSGVSIFDCRFGIHFLGAATTRMEYINVYKTLAGVGGSGSITDQMWAFFIDSSATQGLPDSGNASLTFQNITATASTVQQAESWNSTWDFQGLVAGNLLGGAHDFGIADFWVDTFETNNLGVGINLFGNGVTSGTRPLLDGYQNHDIRFTNLVLDACAICAITFQNMSAFGAVQINNSYVNNTIVNPGGIGIQYINSHSAIAVNNVEYLGATCPTGIAVFAQNSSGIMHKNNVYYECGVTPLQVIGCSNCIFEDMGRQFSTGAIGASVVNVSGVTNNVVFRMLASGVAGAYTYGYHLIDSTTNNCTFDCAGINATAITPSPGKINNNGTVVTAVGVFGVNNYAEGLVT